MELKPITTFISPHGEDTQGNELVFQWMLGLSIHDNQVYLEISEWINGDPEDSGVTSALFAIHKDGVQKIKELIKFSDDYFLSDWEEHLETLLRKFGTECHLPYPA